jgi:hypothetical protein
MSSLFGMSTDSINHVGYESLRARPIAVSIETNTVLLNATRRVLTFPLAFVATRARPLADRPLNPPGKNWPKAFEKRHPETAARRVAALDWNRHETIIAGKITHWFKVIGRVLRDPAILPENVYNMDETGVMLSMLGSVKVLVGKDDKRKHRGARVKRTTVTAVECISADGRYLNPMIIWPATTHRSNWTTFLTPGWHYACNESGYTDSNLSLLGSSVYLILRRRIVLTGDPAY